MQAGLYLDGLKGASVKCYKIFGNFFKKISYNLGANCHVPNCHVSCHVTLVSSNEYSNYKNCLFGVSSCREMSFTSCREMSFTSHSLDLKKIVFPPLLYNEMSYWIPMNTVY